MHPHEKPLRNTVQRSGHSRREIEAHPCETALRVLLLSGWDLTQLLLDLSVALTLFFVPVRFRTLSESETVVLAAETVVSAAEKAVSAAAETAVAESETAFSDSERVRKRTSTKNSVRATLRKSCRCPPVDIVL